MRGLPYRFKVGDQLNNRLEVNELGTNMLALLFRRMRNEMDITTHVWSTMMHKYLRDPRNNIGLSSTARSSEASNLNRGLMKPHMTFMIFLRALRVLNPSKVKFRIELEMKGLPDLRAGAIIEQEGLYFAYSNEHRPEVKNPLNYLLWELLVQMNYVDAPNNTDREQPIKLNEKGKEALNKYLTERRPDLIPSKVTSERSYLTSRISKSVISINVFSKMLQVINPYRMTFGVDLTFGTNAQSNHYVVVEGSSIDPGEKDGSE